MRILKYQIDSVGLQSIPMPRCSIILTAQIQGGLLTIWTVVDESQEICNRAINILGTGWEFENAETSRYISTVQHNGFVWHIFDNGES